MPLAAGDHLGPYQIIGPLGAGGMGEVYRARDPKLGRDVAIKILPAALTQDPERLARFEREARMLASLNHPNIGAIFGLEGSALVLELIEGEDLGERIRPGRGLPVEEAVAIARQIADALDAAHERGIVHRDLKPANIRLTNDGVVKVLDFGLAKSTGEAADLSHSPTVLGPTESGVILGTAPYMSPEQARGKAVDKRTDIWAFGCVLYELLTGRRAFTGETTSDVIVAVLEREPDWSALPASLPAGVRRLIRRCLEKDPKRRLRDIGDARRELDDVDAAPVRSPKRSWLGWAVAAVMTVAAAGFATQTRRAVAPSVDTPTVDRLTFDSGVATGPSLSSDGALLAYASNRSGRADLDIWMQQTAGGSPVRLTDDPADDVDPDLSADGFRVVFRSERRGGGAYVAPALGGPARLVAPDARSPRFSPDGKSIAYWTGQFRGSVSGTNSSVFVLSLSGGTPTRLLPDFAIARDPVWSPDGRALLVIGLKARPATNPDDLDLWRVPIDGRPPTKTTILDRPGWREHLGADQMTLGTWRGSGFLITMEGGLWSLPLSLDSGVPLGPGRALLFGASRVANPTSSESGVVVVSQSVVERVIDRAPLTPAQTPLPTMVLYADGRPGAARVSQTRDGQTIVFERGVPHAWEIWRKDTRGGDQQLVSTVDSRLPLNPTVSGDGARIAYSTSQSSISVTAAGVGYVIDVAGGVSKKLCDDCGLYEFLSDNRRVVTTFADKAIGLVDIVSGAVVNLVSSRDIRIERPSVSPDDRWLAFRQTRGTSAKTFVIPAKAGANIGSAEQIDEPTTTGRPCGWSPDSRILYLLLDTDGSRCLWGQHVDPASGRLLGKPYVVRHFHELNGNLSTSLGNAITAQGFLFETLSVRSSLWRVTPSR